MAFVTNDCIEKVNEKLKSGILFRYHEKKPKESSIVKAEHKLAKIVNKKYGCAINSCGCALFLALKAMGVSAGTKVLVNAFTFDAVPAAIHHCQAKAVLVECTPELTIDLNDLEEKIKTSKAEYLLLSHMRGRIADMDKVLSICKKYNVKFCEDCAHALGCKWNNKMIGSYGLTSCFSFQSHKIINTGEGGFVATSSPDIIAQVILYSGAYELKYAKHFTDISVDVFEKYMKICPNYSMRMTTIQGEILYSQLDKLEERIIIYKNNYEKFLSYFKNDKFITFIQHNELCRPVLDSIQFKLNVTSEQAKDFNKICHNISCQCLGLETNARYYIRWDFVKNKERLVLTDNVLKNLYDMRLPIYLSEQNINNIALQLRKLIMNIMMS